MSYELIMEYYQQVQEIFSNNYFQEYGIIGLFLNSLLSATAIPIPTEILTSALLIGGENIVLVGLALVIGSVIGGVLNYFIGSLVPFVPLPGFLLLATMSVGSEYDLHILALVSAISATAVSYTHLTQPTKRIV